MFYRRAKLLSLMFKEGSRARKECVKVTKEILCRTVAIPSKCLALHKIVIAMYFQ